MSWERNDLVGGKAVEFLVTAVLTQHGNLALSRVCFTESNRMKAI